MAKPGVVLKSYLFQDDLAFEFPANVGRYSARASAYTGRMLSRPVAGNLKPIINVI